MSRMIGNTSSIRIMRLSPGSIVNGCLSGKSIALLERFQVIQYLLQLFFGKLGFRHEIVEAVRDLGLGPKDRFAQIRFISSDGRAAFELDASAKNSFQRWPNALAAIDRMTGHAVFRFE